MYRVNVCFHCMSLAFWIMVVALLTDNNAERNHLNGVTTFDYLRDCLKCSLCSTFLRFVLLKYPTTLVLQLQPQNLQLKL